MPTSHAGPAELEEKDYWHLKRLLACGFSTLP